ncbi:MAG: tetratricopeptide repeat protein [Proteobacteria bacterium]|nr:tetratricopeptide repeat protein [Pseudomonadota bacterium]
METLKKIMQSVLLVILVSAAITFTCPSVCKAGYDFGKLPVSVRLVLSDVRDLMNKKEYDRVVERILAFRTGECKTSSKKTETGEYGHPLICFTLGNCYLLQGNYLNAKKEYTASVKQTPEFLEGWLNLAKTCYELKEYNEAAKCYARAYEQSGQSNQSGQSGRKNPDYLYYCAAGYLMAKEYSLSIDVFERLFQDYSGNIQQQWRENYIHALLSADQQRRALPVIEAVINDSKGKDKTRWQEILLHLYLQLDMRTQALSFAARLARDNPSVAGWWKALVHIYLPCGRYEDALAALTIYGYLTPLTDEEKKLWADLNLQLEIPVRAAGIYENILKDNPDKRLLQNLVAAYRKLNNNEKALELLENFFAKTNDPELLMLRGDLLYTLKRFNEANNTYCRAAKTGSQEVGRAWLMAGYSAWKTKEFDAGCKAFQMAAKYNEQRKAALLAMAEIKKNGSALKSKNSEERKM